MTRRRVNVALDISGTCNLRCKMCYYSLSTYRSKEQLPLAVFEDLCREWGGDMLSLALSMGAEPLVVKSFPDYVDVARRHGVRNLWFVSNATLLTPSIADTIIDGGVQYIALSVDGASKETYEAIRVGATWERTVGNIETLAAKKRERGSATPYLNLHYLLFKSNYHEIVDFVRLASGWDAKEINVGFAVEHEGLDLSDEAVSLEEVAPVLAEAHALAREKGILMTGANQHLITGKANRLGYYGGVAARRVVMRGLSHTYHEIETRLRLPKTQCQYLERYVFIDALGDVRPCCLWFDDPPLGNVRETSLSEVWDGERFTALRTAAPRERASMFESCRNCRSGILHFGDS